MKKPMLLPYRVFRRTPRGSALVIQTRVIGGKAAVSPADLDAYQATATVSSPWGVIQSRSRLLLTPEAARFMVEAGNIVQMDESKI